MNLLVIEGTGKEATIKKFLGSDWEVFATKGHVRDLPEKTIGLDPKTFAPVYDIIPNKESTVKKLIEKTKKAENVFLASDPDREGEAIAWHIAYILNIDLNDNCRVEFNEITKNAVLNGIKNPRKINLDLVDAQQARRVLDRLVGYKISPILCKKLSSNLSAGRVQSVALKLVVDREREILNFKPEEYWTVKAELEKPNEKPTFKALLHSYKSKKIKIKNEQEKNIVVDELKQNNYVVSSVAKRVSTSHAPAPFITSTLQQDASNKLNFSTSTTTKVAQELYEGVELGSEGKVALVTYIRTDSVRVSDEAQKSAKQYITQTYGAEYTPAKPNVYKTKGNAQDAHEAIRPTHIEKTPESVKPYLKPESYKLYKLIYERFLASQMVPAEYNQVSAEIKNGDYLFKVVGKTLKFAGFTKVYENYKEKDEDEDSAKLPNLVENDVLNVLSLVPEQKFTKPAPRFTEATLNAEMESNGIGRPATYAQIFSVLYFRKYVEKEGKALKPTELGFKVNDMLQKYFADIMNVNFTSNMETALDEIAEGQKNWQNVINLFYQQLLPELKNANLDREPTAQKNYEVSDVKCDKCGAMMVIKEGRYGKFLACPNYPKCKNIQSMTGPAKVVGIWPKFVKNVVEKKSKKGTLYYSCEDYKDCKFMSWDLPLSEKCPKCDCYMLYKKTKKSEFKTCSNPDCDYVEKILHDNQPTNPDDFDDAI